MSDENLITVITPTTGKPSLELLIQSIGNQTLSGLVFHYLLWDNCRDPGAKEPNSYNSAERISLVLPPGTGRNVNAPGSPLRAIGLIAASTPWVTFADDDVRWEPDHIESLVDAVKGKNWGSTLRRIWSPTGELLGFDRFESVGDDPSRRVSYEMCDNNCMIFRRELGVHAAALYRETQNYNDDRLMYQFLKQYAGPRGKTGKATINQICPARLVDFFKKNCSPS